LIAPGTPSGTLPALADGDAIGGSAGACQSFLSETGSRWMSASSEGEGDGLGLAAGFASSVPVLPFSSSSSLPTSRVDVSPTSFSAAKTDAPRTATSVLPLLIHDFKPAIPDGPKPLEYRAGEPSGRIRTLYLARVAPRAFAIVSGVKAIPYLCSVHQIEP